MQKPVNPTTARIKITMYANDSRGDSDGASGAGHTTDTIAVKTTAIEYTNDEK